MMKKRSKISKNYYDSPQHVVSKRASALLSKSLREKYNRKTIRVRKNDVVKILRGEYKGIDGKITHIYLQVGKISVDGVTREKLAGGNTPVKIHSSNIIVTSIDFKDKFRKEKMEKVD